VPVVANIGDHRVEVNVGDLVSYGGGMGKLSIEATGQSAGLFMNMAPARQHAFAPIANLQAGQIERAPALMVQQEHADGAFQAFLFDLCTGLTCIGSAATVIGHSYSGADARGAATVDTVRYAFADRDYEKPAGLKLDETIDGRTVQEQRLFPSGYQALQPGATPIRTLTDDNNNTTLYFADGSRRTESSSTTYGTTPEWGRTESESTTTTIYAPNGAAVGTPTVTATTYAVADGRVVNTRVETHEYTNTTVVHPDNSATTTRVRPEGPGEEPNDTDDTVTETDTTDPTLLDTAQPAATAQPALPLEAYASPSLDGYIDKWSDPDDVRLWQSGMAPPA
jgi:hypothetical protein